MENLHNTTFDELRIGATLSVTRSLSAAEIDALGMVAGEPEALHLDWGGPGQPAPHATLARSVSATGLSALVSGLINRQLPGPGSRVVAQYLHYQGRVAVGDSVIVNLTLREKSASDGSIGLDCSIVNQRGETLLTGSSRVIAPTQRIAYGEFATPEVIIRHTDAFAQVLGRCQGLPPATCAVVHPCDRDALLGAVAAQQRGLITLKSLPQVIIQTSAQTREITGDGQKMNGLRYQDRLRSDPQPDLSRPSRHNRAFLRVASGRPKGCECSRI